MTTDERGAGACASSWCSGGGEVRSTHTPANVSLELTSGRSECAGSLRSLALCIDVCALHAHSYENPLRLSSGVIPQLGLMEATDMAMTLEDTLAQLESLGDEKRRAHNRKNGAGENQFGVQLGDIRKLAAKLKTNHQLALALWATGNIDAQLLAILLIKPNTLSRD